MRMSENAMRQGSRGDEDESCFLVMASVLIVQWTALAPRRHLLLDCFNGPFMVNR